LSTFSLFNFKTSTNSSLEAIVSEIVNN
jgi:hypothetical protein